MAWWVSRAGMVLWRGYKGPMVGIGVWLGGVWDAIVGVEFSRCLLSSLRG